MQCGLNTKWFKMINKQYLAQLSLNAKVNKRFRIANQITIEPNVKKRKEAINQLVKDGYLSKKGDHFVITNKSFDEIVKEKIFIVDIWENDRTKGWNKRNGYPFIRFELLTDGQKKTVLEWPDSYQWFVCNKLPLQYSLADLEETDMVEIVDPKTSLADAVDAARCILKETLRKEGRGGKFPEAEIVLKNKGLTEYINRTTEVEGLEKLYRSNLQWALVTLSILNEDDAKKIGSSDEPIFLLGDFANSNVGADPDKWGEKLSERIQKIKEVIARSQMRLAIMEVMEANIQKMGGWDAFRKECRDKLKKAIADKNQAE